MRLPRGVRRLLRVDDVAPTPDRAVDDELDHYFAEAVRSLVDEGVPEDEAEELARRRFGDPRAYRDALITINTERRMNEHVRLVDETLRTIGHALRSLRRAPGFTASVVVILGLGIGANAVMFGVVDRLLLSPPQHVTDPDDVRRIAIERVIFNGETRMSHTMTWPDFRDFDEVGAFAATAGFTEPWEATVLWGDAVEPANRAGASASLFPLLGVQPALGRFYTEEEDRIGAQPVAVLSHEYWARRFGGSADVLGATIDIGGHDYTVVGVAPAGFTGAELRPVDVWVPLSTAQALENGEQWVTSRGWYWVHAVARLRDGASVEAAEAEATAAHRAGRATMIEEDRYDPEVSILANPIIAARGPQPSAEAQVARWLAGVSLIVLLIACFNVMNLLLARAVHMRREMAVRLTLGVGRRRLVGELMAESLVLAGLGALAATLVARFVGGTIHQALIPDVAFTDTDLTTRLLIFTGIATVVAGVCTGIIPALQATRTDLANVLRSTGGGGGSGRSTSRRLLLVGQASLSVVLLVGAGLFVRSLGQAESLDLGIDASRLVVLDLEWHGTLDSDLRTEVYRDVLDGVRRLPGVRAAGLTYTIPFRSSISLGQPRVPGLDSIPRHHNGGPYVNKVGSGYFEATGLTIVRGRAFRPSDDADNAPPVTIVSESMADAIWPAGDALGSCIILGDADDAGCTQVIGVVENHRRQALIEDDPHFLYYVNQSHPEFLGPPQGMMIGAEQDPESILTAVRAEARSTSPRIRFVQAVAMATYIEPELRSWRLGASMFTVFGLLALVVAAWGLYSVLAFDVALRGHELGVRSALGAGVPRIVRLVLRQAFVLVLAGTLVGLAVSAGAARFVEPLLFGVAGTDPLVYGIVATTLMAVAVLAGSLPAWRATRVDPRDALQSD